MLEKILDKAFSEQGILVLLAIVALWKVWNKLEALIDRNMQALERYEQDRQEKSRKGN